jgi:AmiR/NasT family two-component response regulator
MTTAPLRVLVAENQYLIAMEVERILLEALHCDVTIAPLSQLAAALMTSPFDVVIIDAVLAETLNVERTKLIMEAGARPVFLSSYDFMGSGTIISGHPVVTKPPQAEQLAAAVLKAAHARGPSDREGFLDDR